MEKYKKIEQKQEINKNNKNKTIHLQTWNEEFELPGGWNSVLDIQDYFEYIIKKHQKVTDNHTIRMSVSKIENRIAFKIKTGYYFELKGR